MVREAANYITHEDEVRSEVGSTLGGDQDVEPELATLDLVRYLVDRKSPGAPFVIVVDAGEADSSSDGRFGWGKRGGKSGMALRQIVAGPECGKIFAAKASLRRKNPGEHDELRERSSQ